MTADTNVRKIGTLSDSEIAHLGDNGELIVQNFEPSCIKQACYELRAGYVYYDLAKNAERLTVDDESFILLKPRQMVVIITLESIRLPNDMLGRILMKGQLFSLGVSPVNTYADPGFDGQLGIVLFNTSISYIKICPGDHIAKIEFSKLDRAVDHPYVGQHGYHTQIWPIPTHKILTPEEVAEDPRIRSEDEELKASYGHELFSVITRIRQYERKIIVAAAFYFIAMLLLIAFLGGTGLSSVWPAVTAGIVANFLTALAMSRATDFSRRKSWISKS